MKYIAMTAAVVAATGGLLAGACTGAAVAAPDSAHVTAATAAAPVHVTAAAPAKGKVVVPATYNNGCGTGYSLRDTLTVTGGHIYLTYNGSNGYNCVVTVRDATGAAVPMDAWIERSDGSGYQDDPGNYKTYAGPVYVHAAGQCIDWGGGINGYTNAEFDSHCG